MIDKELKTAGKMHETASSIFAHGKHKLSDSKGTILDLHALSVSFPCKCGSVLFHWTMWSMRVVFLLAISYLFSHRGGYSLSPPSSFSHLHYFSVARCLCIFSSFRSHSLSRSISLRHVYREPINSCVCSSAWLSALFDAVSFSPALMIFTVDEFFFPFSQY